MNNLTISDAGLALVRKTEGTRYRLYNDPSGHCTIGTGHLVHLGPICGAPSERPFVNGITPEIDTILLRQDLADAERAVNSMVTKKLAQHQFDALVDFTFNLGPGTLKRSTLLTYLNSGQFDKVPGELKKFNKSGGVKLPGLEIRRALEVRLFEGFN